MRNVDELLLMWEEAHSPLEAIKILLRLRFSSGQLGNCNVKDLLQKIFTIIQIFERITQCILLIFHTDINLKYSIFNFNHLLFK